MSTVTITWQPGSVKGRSVQQTDRLITEACQMWQRVCGVQFLVGPFGLPSAITIYPYAGQMAGAMVAYPATRQILYSTVQQYPSDHWTRAAFAHEIGHCFGWVHSANNLPEHLMHWKGSSVFYHAAAEAQRARSQFGRPLSRSKPWSITWVQQEIVRLRRIKPLPTASIQTREAQLKRLQAEWRAIDGITHVSTEITDHESVCECFHRSRYQVDATDWLSVFAELRSMEGSNRA